jgi:hypothetical protein
VWNDEPQTPRIFFKTLWKYASAPLPNPLPHKVLRQEVAVMARQFAQHFPGERGRHGARRRSPDLVGIVGWLVDWSILETCGQPNVRGRRPTHSPAAVMDDKSRRSTASECHSEDAYFDGANGFADAAFASVSNPSTMAPSFVDSAASKARMSVLDSVDRFKVQPSRGGACGGPPTSLSVPTTRSTTEPALQEPPAVGPRRVRGESSVDAIFWSK